MVAVPDMPSLRRLLQCGAAARPAVDTRSCVTDISIIIYRSSTQHTAPQVKILFTLLQYRTAIRALQLTAAAVEYERFLNIDLLILS